MNGQVNELEQTTSFTLDIKAKNEENETIISGKE